MPAVNAIVKGYVSAKGRVPTVPHHHCIYIAHDQVNHLFILEITQGFAHVLNINRNEKYMISWEKLVKEYKAANRLFIGTWVYEQANSDVRTRIRSIGEAGVIVEANDKLYTYAEFLNHYAPI